ncbi:MAG: DUF371 domain-containing protein [Candidatus Lokiarchaeota archaeon]|nr:DUF371 domain-containing protein [Candidatus Lokiarchaeota archaeon]
MNALDLINVYGHENIQCTHSSTIEITKDKHLTKKGNCILGIYASKACINLNLELKNYIKDEKRIKVIIKGESFLDSFFGYGDKRLSLKHSEDIVFRKSDYICDRTVLINCTKSSSDLSRELIKEIRQPKIEFFIIFEKAEEND